MTDAGEDHVQPVIKMATYCSRHTLSEAYPDLTPEEHAELLASIERLGIQSPVTVFEGKVLDGWNRYQVMRELGRDCPMVELPADTDPVAYVRAQNQARRHLKAGQLAMIEVSLSEWQGAGRPSANQGSGSPVLKTNAQLAARAGVSEKSIKHAKGVAKKAIPKVRRAVREGSLALKDGAALAQLPVAQQVEAAVQGVDGMRARVHQAESADTGPTYAELLADLDAAQSELEGATERIAIMAQNDKAGEIDRLLSRIAALKSHNASLFSEKTIAWNKLDYLASLTDRLKQLLKVQNNSQIEGAVQELLTEVA